MSIFIDAKGKTHWGRRGAGLLLIRPDGHVLLLLRSASVAGPGTWGVPGGKVEEGEDDWDAALIESLEELGSLPEILGVSGRHVYKSNGFTFVTFIVQVDQADAWDWEPVLNWEHDDWGWFQLERLPKPLHPGVKGMFQEMR